LQWRSFETRAISRPLAVRRMINLSVNLLLVPLN
jgi:hypothetical protein